MSGYQLISNHLGNTMKKYLFLIPFFILGILNAQKKKEDDSDKKEKAEKTIADLTKSSKKILVFKCFPMG